MTPVRGISKRENDTLLAWLIAFELGLVGIYAADYLLGTPVWVIHDLFNMNGEMTVTAWFSSLQLFAIGLVFAFKARQTESADRPQRWFYILAAAVFFFLSLDESAAIHERITVVFSRYAWLPRFRDNHGIWIFIYVPIGIILFAASARQLTAMSRRHRRATGAMAVGVAVVLLGAVGFEALGFEYLSGDESSVLFHAEAACEEFCEMCGASLILHGAIQVLIAEPTKAEQPTRAVAQ